MLLCEDCFKATGLKLSVHRHNVETADGIRWGALSKIEKKAIHKSFKNESFIAGNVAKWQFLTKKAAQLRLHPTKSEVIFTRKLEELGIKFIFQHVFLHGDICGISDFYLPDERIVIEIDGGYHLDEDQKTKDLEKDFICETILRKKVMRFTNKQAMFLSIQQIGVLIQAKVEEDFKVVKKAKKKRRRH